MQRAAYGEGVSRETEERLGIYCELLKKWNPRINLVAGGTIQDAAHRHFADSVQIGHLATSWERWVDLGSGGGFPGLVVGCMFPESEVILVESDRRKCLFMETVIREVGIKARTINERIACVPELRADVVSARALAPLDVLLGFMLRHASSNGVGLFLKGRGYRTELEQARQRWTFDHETVQSRTQEDSAILRVSRLKPVSGDSSV